MKKIGAATALEVRATGIQYVFAPCIAVMMIEKMFFFELRTTNYNLFSFETGM